MSVPRACFGMIIQFTMYFMQAYNSPILSRHATNREYSPAFISYGLALAAVSLTCGVAAIMHLQTKM